MNWKNKPSYWDNPEWYTKRANELVKDAERGLTVTERCSKYGISQKRMYDILRGYDANVEAEGQL